MITDETFQNKVKEIFEEEKENGIEGYERFKIKCVENAIKMKKRATRKSKGNKINILREIDEMRKILRWAESANIQEEKGCRIKRWRRGMELIRQSNPNKWLGQTLEEEIDLQELEKKAAYRLEELIDQRDALNERKIHIRKKLEDMENIKEGERIKPSFFHRMKTNFKKKKYTPS